MVNAQTLQGNWNNIKGQIEEHWGEVTHDDLDAFDGSVDRLVGVIQRKTGESRDAIEQFLESASAQSASAVEGAAAHARHYAEQAGQALREGYEQVAGRVQETYAGAERMVQRNPARSVGLAFCTGLVAGVVVGLILRSR